MQLNVKNTKTDQQSSEHKKLCKQAAIKAPKEVKRFKTVNFKNSSLK